jgi:hypothetical protein
MRTRVPFMLAVLGTLASGCGDAAPGVTGSEAAAAAGPTPVPTVTGPLDVRFHRFPAGLAVIGLNSAAQQLSIEIKVGGLTPGSTHAARLLSGSCAHPGPQLHPLQPLLMGGDSIADVHSIVSDVSDRAIPDSGWHLAVYADASASEGATPLMCGDLTNEAEQTVVTAGIGVFVPPGGPDPGAAGTATLRVVGGRLQVVLDVGGLTPGSTHAAQLRRGNCEGEGAVLHPLDRLVADARGHAVSTTLISGISRFPLDRWFVAVSPLATLDPVVCGNVGI